MRVVEAVASTGAPTVVMTYWNPVEHYGGSRRSGRSGVDLFAADLASAGGAGLITPDLTPDAGGEWIAIRNVFFFFCRLRRYVLLFLAAMRVVWK